MIIRNVVLRGKCCLVQETDCLSLQRIVLREILCNVASVFRVLRRGKCQEKKCSVVSRAGNGLSQFSEDSVKRNLVSGKEIEC